MPSIRATSPSTATATRSATTTSTSTKRSANCSSALTTTPRCSSYPTTALDPCKGRSASTNGSLRRAISCSISRPRDRPRSLMRASTGARPGRGGGAGTSSARLCRTAPGREPQGIVSSSEYEQLLDELADRLQRLPGPDGKSIGTRTFRPQELWREQRGIPPDLIVYFGDLGWRSNGSLGHGRHWTYDNDTGPDDANHDRNGLCIVSGPGVRAQRREDMAIYDIAPTILAQAGLPADDGMRGQVLAEVTHSL